MKHSENVTTYAALGLVLLNCAPWDFAAASLILTEAGGVISGLDGKPLDFISPSGVIAGNSAENLKELFTIIQKHI